MNNYFGVHVKVVLHKIADASRIKKLKRRMIKRSIYYTILILILLILKSVSYHL